MVIFAAPSELAEKRCITPDVLVLPNWAVKPGKTWMMTADGKLVIKSPITEAELVTRLHRALAAHPPPVILTYEEQTPAGPIQRLVTESMLYGPGSIRTWFLAFGRELLEESHDRD